MAGEKPLVYEAN